MVPDTETSIGVIFLDRLKQIISCTGIVMKISDVVETVTSETETWLKFRDETETETFS